MDFRDEARARAERDLRRLEALAAGRRRRIALRRALRGLLGGAGSFATMVKLKLAGSLALKLGLAAAVGLGFAWPALALGALAVLAVSLALAALFEGEIVDCSGLCDCDRKEKRRDRLDSLIAQRRALLAASAGAVPAPHASAGPRG